MMTQGPHSESPATGHDESSDLADRLANYRSRVAREGRKTALEKIDRAIEEARRPKRRKA